MQYNPSDKVYRGSVYSQQSVDSWGTIGTEQTYQQTYPQAGASSTYAPLIHNVPLPNEGTHSLNGSSVLVRPQINPILTNGSAKIDFRSFYSRSSRSEEATFPVVHRMSLALPPGILSYWAVPVSASQLKGITVDDILNAIYVHLSHPVSPEEHAAMSQFSPSADAAFRARTRNNKTLYADGVKRFDYFGGCILAVRISHSLDGSWRLYLDPIRAQN